MEKRSEKNDELLNSVRKRYSALTCALIERRITVTAMESCTSGLIASLITDTDHASEIFRVQHQDLEHFNAGIQCLDKGLNQGRVFLVIRNQFLPFLQGLAHMIQDHVSSPLCYPFFFRRRRTAAMTAGTASTAR